MTSAVKRFVVGEASSPKSRSERHPPSKLAIKASEIICAAARSVDRVCAGLRNPLGGYGRVRIARYRQSPRLRFVGLAVASALLAAYGGATNATEYRAGQLVSSNSASRAEQIAEGTNAANLLIAQTGTPAPPPAAAVRGVSEKEIRFGLVAPFTGSARELGRQMKLGVETAFDQVNEAGGVNGRQLRLLAGDDGYEPSRTAAVVQNLLDSGQVFGFIGNVGTPTAAVSVPIALEHRTLFFGAFSGAGLLRRDPPDRYVFNYRASYAEETQASVRYLVKVRRIPPREIVVFAQEDAYGDSGFAGVSKAVRSLPGDNPEIVRLGYKRNTIDVADAIAQMRKLRPQPKAVVMVATYRAAAKFIELTKDLYPNLIYTNVSFVGSTALSDELMLLGARYATGVVVTQVVPAINSYSTIILKYKTALAKYFPGEAADFVSMEGYVDASILIEALKRAGPHLDTESLVDALENLHNFDLGLGATINFSPGDHQAVHKVWGTAIDDSGHYQPIDME